MRFNGVELSSVHAGLSIEREMPPASAHALESVQSAGGDVITDGRLEAGEYIARINIAGWHEREGLDIREKLAAWAYTPGNGTGELVPTHNCRRCYDAKLRSIGAPEFTYGFAVVEVRFAVPRPVARDVTQSRASGAGGVSMRIDGSYAARPAIRQTLAAAANGLTWSMDGAPLLTITGALAAGQTIEMDVRHESLTIDGEHAESRIDVSGTRWHRRGGAMIWLPGAHAITSTDGGAMEARWHDEWL